MRPLLARWLRFNEAAGIPRGRRAGSGRHIHHTPVASMRPRVFPAEDVVRDLLAAYPDSGFNEAAGIPRGRRRYTKVVILSTDMASMRPRVFPAEDAGALTNRGGTMLASMRPRVFPAEDAEDPTVHPNPMQRLQ